MKPTLDELIERPYRLHDLSGAEKIRILRQALWRAVVLEGRIIKLRLVLCGLYALRCLGMK